jgi:hypothetical protein
MFKADFEAPKIFKKVVFEKFEIKFFRAFVNISR